MQKNILIGNGINIQFGGADNYSNSAIVRRMITNIQNGKYADILPVLTVEDHLEILQQLRDLLVSIESYKQNDTYLLKQIEIERIKQQYSLSTRIDEIGIEDYFLALEYGYKLDDSEEFISQAHSEMQMLFLDAIYNDGNINNIDYGEKFGEYIQTFDNVFTLNYDSNLDRYFPDVKHLHGEFSVIAPEYDANSDFSKSYPEKCKASVVMPEYKHIYSNAIMSWLWLEKYGEWSGKEKIYGSDAFQRMEGKLIILGMSPCNDEHIFLMINQSKIKSVDFYYYTDNEKIAMQEKIHKPMTMKKIQKLWESLY